MIGFLLLLIFLSKVSLSFLGFFPKEWGPVIFQYGMHPYVNIVLNCLIGGILSFLWFWKPDRQQSQSRFFRFLLFATSLFLIFVTLLQSFFVHPEKSSILQMAAALMAIFTLYLYGRIIPTSLRPESFLKIIKYITIALCWFSLILLFLSPVTCFKGSRFIGVFKHIPHMVSCATLACFGIYYTLFSQKLSRVGLIWNYLNLFVCFILLLLTGTRSALAAVLFGFILCLFLFPAASWVGRFLKTSVALTGLLVVLFFGHGIADYMFEVVRGEQAIGVRLAQDGLKSRIEEVERGYAMFEKNEWLGQGLLMKFSNGNEAEISGYDANKDPHNLLVSAGVIGGWGFVLISLLAYVTLAFVTVKKLFSKNLALRLLAIYMLTSLPILLIYHMHLSLGGIADRIYWIAIGYMVLKEQS